MPSWILLNLCLLYSQNHFKWQKTVLWKHNGAGSGDFSIEASANQFSCVEGKQNQISAHNRYISLLAGCPKIKFSYSFYPLCFVQGIFFVPASSKLFTKKVQSQLIFYCYFSAISPWSTVGWCCRVAVRLWITWIYIC